MSITYSMVGRPATRFVLGFALLCAAPWFYRSARADEPAPLETVDTDDSWQVRFIRDVMGNTNIVIPEGGGMVDTPYVVKSYDAVRLTNDTVVEYGYIVNQLQQYDRVAVFGMSGGRPPEDFSVPFEHYFGIRRTDAASHTTAVRFDLEPAGWLGGLNGLEGPEWMEGTGWVVGASYAVTAFTSNSTREVSAYMLFSIESPSIVTSLPPVELRTLWTSNEVEVLEGGEVTASEAVHLEDEENKVFGVYGNIVDTNNLPLADVDVRIEWTHKVPVSAIERDYIFFTTSVVSDATGFYSNLIAGSASCTIRFSLDGYSPTNATVADTDFPYNVMLWPVEEASTNEP